MNSLISGPRTTFLRLTHSFIWHSNRITMHIIIWTMKNQSYSIIEETQRKTLKLIFKCFYGNRRVKYSQLWSIKTIFGFLAHREVIWHSYWNSARSISEEKIEPKKKKSWCKIRLMRKQKIQFQNLIDCNVCNIIFSSQDENQSPTSFMQWLHILDIQSRFKTHLKEDRPPFLLPQGL